MHDDSLTHKDLAALTGVSETTIKSYRRKFAGFFPVRSSGKPLRFLPEVAQVCMRIRHCFGRDFSVAETRTVLEKEFPHLKSKETASGAEHNNWPGGAAAANSSSLSTDILRGLSPYMQQQQDIIESLTDKCSLLAAAQAETNTRLLKLQETFSDFLSLFLAREDTLGRGLDALDAHLGAYLRRTDTELQELVRELGQGVEGLRAALLQTPEQKSVLVTNTFGDATRYVFRSTGPAAERPQRAEAPQNVSETSGEAGPPAAMLRAPLVVRTDMGEFLGIAGRAEGAFCLNDFIALLHKSYPPPQHFLLDWRTCDTGWILTAEQAEVIRPLKYALYVGPSTTPKGNEVTVLQRLDRNGREQPSPNLYAFIRRMKALEAADASEAEI